MTSSPPRWKRVLKAARWPVGVVAGGFVCAGAAWFAFNNRWVDDAPHQVPPSLQLPQARLPDERNAFFTLIGLTAPETMDPAEAGMALWARDGEETAAPGRLAWPRAGQEGTHAAWGCDLQSEDCMATWRANAAALTQDVQRHQAIGARCEAMTAGLFEMEERLPEPRAELKKVGDLYGSRSFAPYGSNAAQCLRWLQVRAALADARGDTKDALGFLRQSDALAAGLLRGSQSLIGSLLSWSLANRQWRAVTSLAAARPALAAPLESLVRPLPPEALDPSRWMRGEALFGRQSTRELGEGCQISDGPWRRDAPLRCTRSISFMPQATIALLDRQWIHAVESAKGGPLSMLDWQPEPEGTRLFGFSWRNTLGHMLVEASQDGWAGYPQRQATLQLQQTAASLALQARQVPAADRDAWLADQAIDARLRDRLTFKGEAIVAQAFTASADGQTRYLYPIPRHAGGADS